MARHKAILLLVFSIVISVIAVWGGVQWTNRQVEKRTTHQTIKLVVASANLSPGTKLAAELMKTVDWPVESPVSGGVNDIQLLITRVVTVSLAPGEPILEQKLAPMGSRAGLSALITPGMRAVAVRVNDVAGVAGFALPGNHVDVMVNIQDEQGHTVSKIVLQKIMVLAVAQDAALKDDVKAKVVNAVTLEVTPLQAEKLDLARSAGSLTLALRGQMDQDFVQTPGVRKSELLGQDSPRPISTNPPVSRDSAGAIEIIRGTVRSTASSH